MEDKRFKHIATDPKFRRIPKSERKVKIDKRFQSMFKDKKFKLTYTTDKRGRLLNKTSTEDLRRFYDLSSEDESSEPEESTKTDEDDSEQQESNEKDPSDLKTKDSSDKTVPEDIKKKLKNLAVDYARGETALCSDSSDDEESDEFSEEETIEHKWGELDADAASTEEATPRLAACNMDWDRIRAVDLMVLFNSFLPTGGVIKSVAIYPSEFGKKRMKEEEIKGPTELIESKKVEDDDDNNEEGSGYHMEKLRQYQLNRLKYYYSVVTFDSANTANKVYSECDGMEYESSAVKLDLRFVPDDMEFDDEPKDFCDKLPEVNKYQPRFFTTTALQQAKVDLTWDETNPDRLEFTQKLTSGKIDDIAEDDLQNYLASSSDEENEVAENSDGEVEGDVIGKYKALLQDIEGKEKTKNDKDIEMEISWGIDLQEKTEKLIKEKSKVGELTPFQKYLEKKKEKRKQKREQHKQKSENNKSGSESDIPSDIDLSDPYFAEEFAKPEFKKKGLKKNETTEDKHDEDDQNQTAELELLLMNENESSKNFSLKKIQEREKESKKKKKKRSGKNEEQDKDDFEINVGDERFSALYTSHHYNIDPTDPHYKKTKAMETLVGEKLKKRMEDDGEMKQVKKPKIENRQSAELSLLVKSVKRKSKDFKRK